VEECRRTTRTIAAAKYVRIAPTAGRDAVGFWIRDFEVPRSGGQHLRMGENEVLRSPKWTVPIENSILLKKGKPRQEGTKFVRS